MGGRWGGGGVLSEETDRTKGCKIHFPFLFLSNRGAEVAEGECGAFVNTQRRENGAIKFISSVLILYFLKKERGLTSGVCCGCSYGKKEARSEAVSLSLIASSNKAERQHVPV